MARTDFYSGFEGEPEVRFAAVGCDGSEGESVRLWEGYFDALMQKVAPEASGWTGLALPYHLHGGWYDRSPWPVPDVAKVLSQWRGIDARSLGPPHDEAHAAVLQLLSRALSAGQTVVVAYE